MTNEWLKLDQRALFVERELGEALKRTDLPEGFCPQDLRWRWNALRLVLPAGLFGGQGQVFEGDVPAASWDILSITFLKINKGQCFDYHPDLSKEAQAVFHQNGERDQPHPCVGGQQRGRDGVLLLPPD